MTEPLIVPASLDSIAYVEARHWNRTAGPQPKWWIVLHAMQYPEKSDAAEWCANYLRDLGPNEEKSAHACVDSNSIVQCVPWDCIAWHAPGANRYGIGIEHAGWSRQTLADWQDAYSRSMLELSAWLAWQLCARFRIPPRFVDAAGLRAGVKGITTHAQCTKAWPEKSHGHTDPGAGFPIRGYLERVARHSLAPPQAPL